MARRYRAERRPRAGGIAPLGALDQVRLLRAGTVVELLSALIEATEGAAEMLAMPGLDDDDFTALLDGE